VRRRIVPELDDAGVAIERPLHDAPLNAAAASVHESDLAETCFGCRVDVGVDDGRNVARSEGVQIDLAFDRNADFVSQLPTVGLQLTGVVFRLDDCLDAAAD